MLREEAPVFYDETWELNFVGRHEMVSSILKDRERFGRDFRHRLSNDDVDPDLYRRIYPPQWPTWTRYIRESFIDLEPPRHTRLRRLVSKAFTRRSSEVFRYRLEEAADRILDEVLDEGSMDAISQYAAPIPVAMIAELMGIPGEDHAKLLDWSHAIVKVFDQDVTDEVGGGADQATADFVAYLESILEERRGHRGEDLISAMLDVEESGDTLTDEEIIGTSILTLNAGHEATVHAIGNGILALASNPAQYQALHQDQVSIATAVDELLRFDSPLQMFERWVLEDTALETMELSAGTKVGLLFGSANHDPRVFGPNADRLDLSRNPNPHVSYGAGLHFCVGASLATVELEAAFSRLAKRVRRIGLVEGSDRIRSLVFRGVERLVVELEAG